MLHALELCLLDYDFHVLSRSFLVHRGVKWRGDSSANQRSINDQNRLIKHRLVPELTARLGFRDGCFPKYERKTKKKGNRTRAE